MRLLGDFCLFSPFKWSTLVCNSSKCLNSVLGPFLDRRQPGSLRVLGHLGQLTWRTRRDGHGRLPVHSDVSDFIYNIKSIKIPHPIKPVFCGKVWNFPGSSKASKIDPALSCTCQMWLSASTLRMSKGLQGIAMGHPIPMGFGGGNGWLVVLN